MAVKLAPIFVGQQFFTAAGLPLSGGTITTYTAGTTTLTATYTDNTGVTPNANPIVLDSAGRYSSQIWLTSGTLYKFVLKDSGGTILLTEDNLQGVNDGASSTPSEWVVSGLVPTFISTTQFSLAGNQTTNFQVGRRLQITVNAGTVYGSITASVFTSLTTVTVLLDSGVLDVGISVVNYGILGEVNPSVPTSIPYAINNVFLNTPRSARTSTVGVTFAAVYVSAPFPVSAGTILVGDTFRIRSSGTCTMSSNTSSLQFNVTYGPNGTTADTAAGGNLFINSITTGATGSSSWSSEILVTFTAIGASPSALASAQHLNNTNVGFSTNQVNVISNQSASGTNSTLVNEFLGLVLTGSASTTATISNVVIEKIR